MTTQRRMPPKPPRKPAASEHQEQAALIEWCERLSGRYPDLALLFAIPNGGHRHPAVAAKLRAEGVKPGVPDLFLATPDQIGCYAGLFVEMKRKGGRLSDAQRLWHHRLVEAGYALCVAYSWTRAAAAICSYLGIPAADCGIEEIINAQ
jgi:hypothetical protein